MLDEKKPQGHLRTWLALTIATLALASLACRGGPKPPRVVDIREELTRLAAMDLFAGSLLIAQGDEILLHEGFGMAKRESQLPFTAQTVSSIGSITKQFTGAAILKLEEIGKLRVNDSLQQHFADVPADKAAITLHQLLTHTAGMPTAFGPDEEYISREELLATAWSSELIGPPGGQYEYSNVGYSILAAIIEKASGTSYEAFLRETFFQPLGMNDTGYVLPGWDSTRLAVGYDDETVFGTVIEHQDAERGFSWHLIGNGGIHSTTLDMYSWLRALRQGQVLSEESLAKLFSRAVDEGEGESFYGYGWVVFDLPNGVEMIGHNGGNDYFFADLNFFPQLQDLGYILLTNDERQSARASQLIGRRLMGEELPIPPRPVSLPGSRFSQEDVGTYVLPSGEAVRLHAEEQVSALRLEPLSLRAHAELFARSDKEQRRFAELSETSQRMVTGIVQGDLEPLFEAYDRRHPLVALEQSYGERIDNWQAAFGPVVRGQVLGTERGPNGSLRTFFEIVFERRTRGFYWTWRKERLDGFTRRQRPRRLRFYSVGEGVFQLFDSEWSTAPVYSLVRDRDLAGGWEFRGPGRSVELRPGDRAAD